MTNEEEITIDKSLNIVEGYLQRLHDPIVGEFHAETGDENRVEGLVASHGDHTVLIGAAEEWEHITIRYPFDLDQVYAVRRLAGASTEEVTEVSDELIQQAREELDMRIDEIPVDDRRRFRLKLVSELTHGSVSTELDTTSPLNIHGFRVSEKCHIHEDNVGFSDFAKAKQTVVSVGWLGKELMVENYGFRPIEAGDD